ncbi:MAG TPA: alpha-ketoacid dehydrogenase subunit beta [Thermodesulfobacteriota bacterium]|nr:alpha-ketoacid dehydrogenase subunit beta [Thermodesulfobacteriota bacterium]
MASKEMTYAEAIREGLREEMKRDEKIILLGEDIKINVWTVTRGLYEEFGDRVINAPLSESGFSGAAVGAALTGMRPVVEIMYPDFTLYAADSIANQAAKYRYMCGGGNFHVPVVFRIGGSGSSGGSGCHHGQSLEATFIHFPGLKVVFSSSPYDAKGLIKSAIRDNNPVLFYEHKLLYGVKGMIPEEEYLVPIGKAEVKREGKDVTIVSYAWTLHKALKAAEELAKEGIEAEVIDLRSLRPMDKDCILNSVKKTSKLVTAEEGTKMGGVGAEIAAMVAEEGLQYLDAPVKRIAGAESIIPSSAYADQMVIPQIPDIVREVKELF